MTRYRHLKRGTTYEVISVEFSNSEKHEARGERAWCATLGEWAKLQGDIVYGSRVVFYRAEEDGTLWAREHGEFFDGRFEEIPATTASAEPVADNECPECVGTGSEESHNAYHIDGGFQPCSHCSGTGVTAPSHDTVTIDRNELRRHVIANHVRLTSGGGMVPNGRSCKICMGEWADGATENHALTCPLDSSAPPRKERGAP